MSGTRYIEGKFSNFKYLKTQEMKTLDKNIKRIETLHGFLFYPKNLMRFFITNS